MAGLLFINLVLALSTVNVYSIIVCVRYVSLRSAKHKMNVSSRSVVLNLFSVMYPL